MNIQAVKVARIFYRTDAGRTDAEELSLGALVLVDALDESRSAKVSMVMLMARSGLDPSWATKMNPVARTLLAEPVAFFQSEIDAAMKANVDDLLMHLAGKFNWSISISAPASISPSKTITDTLAKIIANQLPDSAPDHAYSGNHAVLLHASHTRMDIAPSVLVQMAGPDLQGAVEIDTLPPAWMIDYTMRSDSRVN